jgi:hypothetical protein
VDDSAIGGAPITMVWLPDRPDRGKSQPCTLSAPRSSVEQRDPSDVPAIGRCLRHEQAAIAPAVVSTKAGKLKLDRTLWGMWRAAEPKLPPKTPRDGGLRRLTSSPWD